jgi:hypothetical protein
MLEDRRIVVIDNDIRGEKAGDAKRFGTFIDALNLGCCNCLGWQ